MWQRAGLLSRNLGAWLSAGRAAVLCLRRGPGSLHLPSILESRVKTPCPQCEHVAISVRGHRTGAASVSSLALSSARSSPLASAYSAEFCWENAFSKSSFLALGMGAA